MLYKSGGGRIRTDDLEVMSLASYLAAPPRDNEICYPSITTPAGEVALSAGFTGGTAVGLLTIGNSNR